MEPEEFDYNRVMCGTIPRIKENLDAARGDRVVFLVRAAMLSEVVSALGMVRGWEMTLEEQGEAVRLVFCRVEQGSDDLLRLV